MKSLIDNYVNLGGAQDILGPKSFTKSIQYKTTTLNTSAQYPKSFIIKDYGFSLSDNLDYNKIFSYIFFDKDNVEGSSISFNYLKNGNATIELVAKTQDSDKNNITDKINVGVNKNGQRSTYAPAVSNTNGIVTQPALNIADKGYLKLGNGLIVQWGRSTGGTVTFSTPFSSATSYGLGTSYYNTIASDHQYGSTNNFTSTGFQWVTLNSDSVLRWIAIGH